VRRQPRAKARHSAGIPIIRVTPKLLTLTISEDAMSLLGQPTRALFHHLGAGRVVIEPAAGKPSRELFDRLNALKVLSDSRVVWLTGHRCAVGRTPPFLVNLGPVISKYPVVGRRLTGTTALFFEFGKPPALNDVSLETVLSSCDGQGSTLKFEDVFVRRRRKFTTPRSVSSVLVDRVETGVRPVPILRRSLVKKV
jgi:hypothetical protein